MVTMDTEDPASVAAAASSSSSSSSSSPKPALLQYQCHVVAMKGTWRVVAGLLVFWLVILVYMSTTLYSSSDVTERTERQLAKALQELDALKKQNQELQKLAGELKDIRLVAGQKDDDEYERLRKRLDEANKRLSDVISAQDGGKNKSPAEVLKGLSGVPTLDHERLRMKIENGIIEQGYFLRSELTKLKKMTDNDKISQQIQNVYDSNVDQQRVILTDLWNLSQSNGHGDWREQEAKSLSDLVQARIKHLQNPKNCNSAKKLVCNLNKGCGYGCQIHHLSYCFIIAFGTERTLILDSRGWRYSTAGWEKVFMPLSDTCTDRGGSSTRQWGPDHVIKDVQVVDLPIVDSLHPRPPYMPQAIPEDISERLMRLHTAPIVWWVGQFLKYTLRPQPELAKDMEDTKRRLGFKSPIVGVHVRRTDKVGTEASFHGIEEYMVYVKEYYDFMEHRKRINQRRVYLATDDPGLLAEARQKFPEYVFISDNQFSKSAGLGTRYSDASLRGIIMDVHFLSLSDYLVCTFSSQVCRLAYEMMQTMHADAGRSFHSLDDIYYYGGQNAHNQVALYSHQPRDPRELELQPGDLIGIAGNHWDGYSKGRNKRTGKTGLYPSYKVEEKIDIVNFPSFPEVKQPER